MAEVYYWAWRDGNVGHLSMSLSDGTYLSYWPQDAVNVKNDLFSKCPGSQLPNLRSDIESEGRQPDVTESIPSGAIDEYKIKTWWSNIIRRGTEYNMLWSNCSHMIRRALEVGGLDRKMCEVKWYSPFRYVPVEDTFPLEPAKVLHWIQKCKCYLK